MEKFSQQRCLAGKTFGNRNIPAGMAVVRNGKVVWVLDAPLSVAATSSTNRASATSATSATSALEGYLHLADPVHFRKGQVLFSQGRRTHPGFYWLKTGRVKFSLLTQEGAERVVAIARRARTHRRARVARRGQSESAKRAGSVIVDHRARPFCAADSRPLLLGRALFNERQPGPARPR